MSGRGAEGRKQKGGRQKAVGRKQKAESKKAESRRQQAEGSRQKAEIDWRTHLSSAFRLLPAATAYCILPSAYCLLPSAYCLLPSAFCLLPSAFCLLSLSRYPRETDDPPGAFGDGNVVFI